MYRLAHLCVPSAEWFDGTAEHDDLSYDGRLNLNAIKATGSCPALFDIIEAQVQADGLR